MKAQAAAFDLLVIGGGINGAGIARDAAMRGLSVCLLDAGDWGAGTSSRSSMLAHGGLRYLEQFELGLVHEALQERERMFRDAPHLVRPLRFLYPLYPHIANRRVVRVGLWLYDLLSYGKSVPKRGYLSARAVAKEEPTLRTEELKGAATYWDGQFVDAERFVLELVLDARRHGAACRNHTKVTGLLIEDGSCHGVDTADGPVHARTVINAAGPWVDAVLGSHLGKPTHLIRKTKGIHLVLPRFTESALIIRAKDGRTFFCVPWRDHTLVGTTDTDFPGDARDAVADADDVQYLKDSAAWYFPEVDLSQMKWTYAGIRPLVNEEGLTESNVTRKHVLHDHADDGVKGLWSIQGGKLTTYRSLSEHAVDAVVRTLGRKHLQRSHPTRHAPFPGAPLVPWDRYRAAAIEAARTELAVHPEVARWLVETYGAGWRSVVEGRRDSLATIKAGVPWLAVDHAVGSEDAGTLEDVLFRRVRLCPPWDERVARQVARRMQSLLHWSDTDLEDQVTRAREHMAMFAVPAPDQRPAHNAHP